MDKAPGEQHPIAEPLWPALVVPLFGLSLAGCGAVLWDGGGVPPGTRSSAGALVGLSAAALGFSLVLAWTVATALATLAVLAERHRWDRLGTLCRRCSPAVLRRAAATVLGLQLLTAPAASAGDAPSPFWGGHDGATVPGAPTTTSAGESERSPSPARAHTPAPAAGASMPGLPQRPPDASARREPTRPSPAQRTVDGALTVVRGDTLWSLAAAHLGPGATDEQIACAWPVWYELNRHVLPDGPHLLLPGQQLMVPGTGSR